MGSLAHGIGAHVACGEMLQLPPSSSSLRHHGLTEPQPTPFLTRIVFLDSPCDSCKSSENVPYIQYRPSTALAPTVAYEFSVPRVTYSSSFKTLILRSRSQRYAVAHLTAKYGC